MAQPKFLLFFFLFLAQHPTFGISKPLIVYKGPYRTFPKFYGK